MNKVFHENRRSRSILNKSCASHLGTITHCLTGHVYSSSDTHIVRLSHVHYKATLVLDVPRVFAVSNLPRRRRIVRFWSIHHPGHNPDVATCPFVRRVAGRGQHSCRPGPVSPHGSSPSPRRRPFTMLAQAADIYRVIIRVALVSLCHARFPGVARASITRRPLFLEG